MKILEKIKGFLNSDRIGLVLKSADTVLMSMMIAVVLPVLMRNEPFAMSQFLFAIILGFVVFAVSGLSARYLPLDQSNRPILLLILGLGTIILVEGVFLYAPFALYKIFRVLAFAYIWTTGQNYAVRHDRIKTVRQKTLTTIFVLTPLIYLLSKGKFSGTFQSIASFYFPFYCIVALLNLNLVNMRSAYDTYESNGINRDANLSRFSRITIGFIAFLFVLFQMRHLGLFQLIYKGFVLLSNLIILVLQLLVLPFAYLVSLLTEKIKLMNNGEQLAPSASLGTKDTSFFKIPPEMEISNFAEMFFTVLVSVVIILIVYLILKKVSQHKNVTVAPGADEERTFIFDLKNPLSDLLKKWTKRHQEDVIHSKIRIKYREALSQWKQKGFEKNRHLSPDEYLNVLEQKGQIQPDFTELTQDYKKVRYGNQDL